MLEQTMEAKNRSSTHEDDGVSLPEDIILAVLVRLPVRDLCRFLCVSKAWRALISDPSFFAAHRSHAGNLIIALFRRRPDYELRVLDMNGDVLRVFDVKEARYPALTCQDDLICIDRDMRLGAMIVDPAARRAFTVGRNVDDRAYWSNFSFGRATPSGAYKVLRLYGTDTVEGICEIATITDDSAEPIWRLRPTPVLFTCCSAQYKATVNGVLYFMPDYDCAPDPVGYRVAAFDLESEAWMETINGPPLAVEVGQEEWHIGLADLKGILCMVQSIIKDDVVNPDCVEGGLGLFANVWRLMDYNKNVWVKAYKIRMPAECMHVQVFDALDDGRILLLNGRRSGDILQFFSPSSEAFTDIMVMPERPTEMTFYTGSLLSSEPVLHNVSTVASMSNLLSRLLRL